MRDLLLLVVPVEVPRRPLVGFVVAPWTTLMWVLCAPGGITGFDHVLVGLGALLDLSTLAGGGDLPALSDRRRDGPALATRSATMLHRADHLRPGPPRVRLVARPRDDRVQLG